MPEELSISSALSTEENQPFSSSAESAVSSSVGRTRPKQGHGSRTYANFRSALAAIWMYKRSSFLAVSGVFIGAMIVMATDRVVQSTNTLFSLHLYAQVATLLLVSIGGVSFTAGGLILMSIFLVEGIERSQEFAMRLVVGARRRDLRDQLLFEALFLSVIGGVSGSTCGLLAGFLFTFLLHLPWIMHPVSLVLLVSASVVAGTLGGVYPAVRSSHQTLEL